MAETITSVGLMGLPHYRNSRASMSMYEPLYDAYFTVQLTLPQSLVSSNESGGTTTGNANLLLENVTKVDGLDTNKMMSETVTQQYKFTQRSFAGGKPTETTIDVGFDFETNLSYDSSGAATPSNYIIRTLRKWTDLIYDPLTGRTGLKVNYVAPTCVITKFDRAYNPYWQWTLYNIFPITKIPEPTNDFSSNGIYKISGWKVRCDYWDEIQL